MTIGITGPERKAPRQSAVVGFIIAAVFVGICLILLWLASDFPVPVGNSILLATDIESGDAPALCERFVA